MFGRRHGNWNGRFPDNERLRQIHLAGTRRVYARYSLNWHPCRQGLPAQGALESFPIDPQGAMAYPNNAIALQIVKYNIDPLAGDADELSKLLLRELQQWISRGPTALLGSAGKLREQLQHALLRVKEDHVLQILALLIPSLSHYLNKAESQLRI